MIDVPDAVMIRIVADVTPCAYDMDHHGVICLTNRRFR